MDNGRAWSRVIDRKMERGREREGGGRREKKRDVEREK